MEIDESESSQKKEGNWLYECSNIWNMNIISWIFDTVFSFLVNDVQLFRHVECEEEIGRCWFWWKATLNGLFFVTISFLFLCLFAYIIWSPVKMNYNTLNNRKKGKKIVHIWCFHFSCPKVSLWTEKKKLSQKAKKNFKK